MTGTGSGTGSGAATGVLRRARHSFAVPAPGRITVSARSLLSAPGDPGRTATRTSRFVGSLFVAVLLLQRIAVPGLPAVSVLVPVALVWTAWGLHRGLLELDRTRLVFWCVAAGGCALAVCAQFALVRDPIVSPTSWALLVTVWLPVVCRLRTRTREVFVASLRVVVTAATVLAAGCLVMMATQFAGVPYRDHLAAVVPARYLLQDFIITYPVTYGSDLYRANAWIGLEPSMVSYQLGIGLLAAVLVGARWWIVLVLVGGLIAATSGSGLFLIAVGVVVILLHRARGSLVRYVPVTIGALLMLYLFPWSEHILSRVGEVADGSSSASLRGITPYGYLWPTWVGDPMAVLFGRGAGSSQQLVTDSGILGLLVSTPIKIFFDYGLVFGALLAAFLVHVYVGGPSRAFSISLFVSLWALQPGTTTSVVIIPLILVVTWWAPRVGDALEDRAEPRTAGRWSL